MLTEIEAATQLSRHINGGKDDRLKAVHALAAWDALGADFLAYSVEVDWFLVRWDEEPCNMGELMGFFASEVDPMDAADAIMSGRA